jgi:pimeloyl-ACP methyl ester carboxylesterase
MQPETRYASSGGVNIAYQVLGTGPHDLVFVLGWVSNIEGAWEQAALARFLTHLSSFSRLILFDKRGTGLSDRVTEMPSLEVRMDDVRAVMDAADSDRAITARRSAPSAKRRSSWFAEPVCLQIIQWQA